jgi:hypothetical protein
LSLYRHAFKPACGILLCGNGHQLRIEAPGADDGKANRDAINFCAWNIHLWMPGKAADFWKAGYPVSIPDQNIEPIAPSHERSQCRIFDQSVDRVRSLHTLRW